MKIVELEICDSTNDEAWKLITPSEPVLVTTHKQLAGRGTQGRVWVDGSSKDVASGNLMASLGFVPHSVELIKHLPEIPLMAGNAAIEAIVQTCFKLMPQNVSKDQFHKNKSALHLKWPNDIMFKDAKMGGILCESRMSGSECLGIVVGLGLNVMKAPVLDVKTASILENLLEKRGKVDAVHLASLRGSLSTLWASLLLERIQ